MILVNPKECKHCSKEYISLPQNSRAWINELTNQTMGYSWDCKCGTVMFVFMENLIQKDFKKLMNSEETVSSWVNDFYQDLKKKLGA